MSSESGGGRAFSAVRDREAVRYGMTDGFPWGFFCVCDVRVGVVGLTVGGLMVPVSPVLCMEDGRLRMRKKTVLGSWCLVFLVEVVK